MNLVAASKRSPEIYVALGDNVAIYDTPAAEGVNAALKPERRIRRSFGADGSEGYIYPQYVFSSTRCVPLTL
jgi:hypothetical protein